MSALNVCHKPDRLIIMQDAAKYAPDGEILDFVSKGIVLEEKNLFVAACGPDTGPEAYARFLDERFGDIDQIGECGEGDMRALYAAAKAKGFVRGGICLVVGGWSKAHGRPRCVLFSAGIARTGDIFIGDIGSNVHPALSHDTRRRWESFHGTPDVNIGRFDPMRDGLHLMELQRRQQAGGERGGQYIVGGHVKLTEVFQDRIEQRIIRTWSEDEVGRKIIPGPMPEVAGRVAQIAPAIAAREGMSRQQRRRAEKLAKKGRAA